jgi:hypothetical protein
LGTSEVFLFILLFLVLKFPETQRALRFVTTANFVYLNKQQNRTNKIWLLTRHSFPFFIPTYFEKSGLPDGCYRTKRCIEINSTQM